MIRYLRLYLHFIQMSVGQATAYRFDFWCRIIMDLSYYVVSLAFFEIIFTKTTLLGGWTQPQVYIFVATYLVLDAIQMTIFSSNLWGLSTIINEGGLDYYLVKPVSTLFFLSLREFAVNSCINLVLTIGFLIWTIGHYDVPFSIINFLAYIFFLMNGVFLYYNARLLFSLPVFWTHAPYGFERIFYSLLSFMERPDGLFRGPVRWFIFNILPFALMVSVPARVFFEGPSWPILMHTAMLTVLFSLFVQWIWRKGLGSYASASS